MLSRALEIKWQGPVTRNEFLQQVSSITFSLQGSNTSLTSLQGSLHITLTKFLLFTHVDVIWDGINTLRRQFYSLPVLYYLYKH
jgi:hypothetical protein